LNLAWQPIFFKLKKLGLAQFENLLVLGTAVATMGAFYKARTFRRPRVLLQTPCRDSVSDGSICPLPSLLIASAGATAVKTPWLSMLKCRKPCRWSTSLGACCCRTSSGWCLPTC